jgi:hypothetical protein
MVDISKQVDLGGNDLIVDAVSYATTSAQSPMRVFDITGSSAPVVASGTTATITLANMFTGMIICTNAAAVTVTIDTAANLVSGLNALGSGAHVGDTITFDVSSGSANTGGVTIAANASGGTLNAGSSATITTGVQKTVIVRITNVSTPAYTVYC